MPVVAPLGINENSQTFNINADTAAGAIAKELKARRLLIISDVEGVLDKNKKLITEINSKKAKEMINESKQSIESTIDKKKKEAVDSVLGGT